MLNKVLIANRGEIGLRVLRACRELGIHTVAIYSTTDRDLMHVRLADEAVCIGPANANQSYLNIPAVISAAEVTDVDAIHPGYGFLSENADFAEQVENSGFMFIGPKKETISLMGNKVSAIRTMKKSGVPCIPGSNGAVNDNDQQTNKNIAKEIGYPLIIKSAGGGGGRGMRIVRHENELISTINMTSNEAQAAFGDNRVYMEKYLENPRHVEIQVLGDGQGNVIYLGERDCSVQRRHQKLIEEAPAPGITEDERQYIGKICAHACRKLNYRGAGTFEFLYDQGQFYFIEMNTRIQVEHGVTEMITGIDLVKEQLRIAAGEKLRYKQHDIYYRGHAIECRINAENPNTLMPSPGKITLYHQPGGPGIRVDSHIYSSYHIPPYYDSMIGKIMAHGEDRATALTRMYYALEEMLLEGIDSNITMHQETLCEPSFKRGGVSINYFENKMQQRSGELVSDNT